jgi:sulfatase maturation enzyme AslB (radical SAM superfamily)
MEDEQPFSQKRSPSAAALGICYRTLKTRPIVEAWGRILRGYKPLLSIEITKECPLRCPGCYAYEPQHLGGVATLRQLTDYKGSQLVEGVLALVRRHRPLHVSLVGGEPLVRYRELEELLPKLERMGLEVQVVTSAVRPIPAAWASLRRLSLVVSIDGLREEHDRRREPATYDRILRHIAGHRITVHCTITRQQLQRPGYLDDFAAFWSERAEVRRIWFSLFTPQQGEQSDERLTPIDRSNALARLSGMRARFPKVDLGSGVLNGYERPPSSPEECIFAQTTMTVSADLRTRITPCQFGGAPECRECGCMASAGLASVGRHRLGGLIPIDSIFAVSRRIGEQARRLREGGA